jgi:hypothetical protein
MRIGGILLVTFECLAIFIVSKGAVAQGVEATPATPPPSPKAIEFFRQMTPFFKKGMSLNSIEMEKNRVKSGYYRYIVTRNTSPNVTDIQSACKVALKASAGGNSFQDVIFQEKSSIGISLQLALADGITTDFDKGPRAEISLFRMDRKSSSKCALQLSYFETAGQDKYYSPLIPINHGVTADPQQARITFIPWVTVEKNMALMNSAWAALKSVPIVGAVTAFLGGGATDSTGGLDSLKQQFRAGVNDTVLSFAQDIQSTADAQKIEFITVNPTTGTSPYAPEKYDFRWDLNWTVGGQAKTFAFDYSVAVDYRGSLLFDGRNYPILAAWSQEEFRALMEKPRSKWIIGATGPSWEALNDDVQNFRDQTTIEGMQGACLAVRNSLENYGLSFDDQMLIIYSLAYGTMKSDAAEVGKLRCLNKDLAARDALARYGIPLDLSRSITLNPTNDAQRNIFMQLSKDAFTAPSSIGQGNISLRPYLEELVQIGGRLSLLKQATLGSDWGSLAGSIAANDYTKNFKKLQVATSVGCALTLPKVNGNTSYFPSGSGLPRAEDQVVAHLVRTANATPFIVMWGIKGADLQGRAKISQMWVGDTFEGNDATLSAVRTAMAADASCVANPQFKDFVIPAITIPGSAGSPP